MPGNIAVGAGHSLQTQTEVLAAIKQASQETGVPFDLAVAVAMQESGLDPYATGDPGYFDIHGIFHPSAGHPDTSFGLYMLHQGGLLGSLTPEQAKDPLTNARVALRRLAQVLRQNPGVDPGHAAAISQGPANPSGYAAKINQLIKSGAAKASAALAGDPSHEVNLDPFGIGSAVGAVVGFIGRLTDPHLWWRVGLILGGAILVGLGVLFLARGNALPIPG